MKVQDFLNKDVYDKGTEVSFFSECFTSDLNYART